MYLSNNEIEYHLPELVLPRICIFQLYNFSSKAELYVEAKVVSDVRFNCVLRVSISDLSLFMSLVLSLSLTTLELSSAIFSS